MALAFVTGGSRGLGFESAKALKELGHEVVLFARDTEKLRQAGSQLNSPIEFVELSDIAVTRNVFKAAVEKYGIPEILMLAHGVMSDRLAKTLKTTDDEWRRVMTINLDSVFTIVNEVGSKMADARNGRIIIYSACLGRMSGPGNAGGLAPYRISKAGVNALVRNLAHETGHGSRGLWIDAICPNHSRTDMGGENAPRSAAEGAATAVWLATRELIAGTTQTGLLWEDNEVVPW
ncbi:MAG: SDR family NAD(P)-dependent oxidoreductase [Candidatus Nanopelagicaceae bacterium]|nr:SDR family NAD(P)-dependent oxidoreductase [Candidatus Nanopelagicaceae bacterium]